MVLFTYVHIMRIGILICIMAPTRRKNFAKRPLEATWSDSVVAHDRILSGSDTQERDTLIFEDIHRKRPKHISYQIEKHPHHAYQKRGKKDKGKTTNNYLGSQQPPRCWLASRGTGRLTPTSSSQGWLRGGRPRLPQSRVALQVGAGPLRCRKARSI
jgi:hypothetical protein